MMADKRMAIVCDWLVTRAGEVLGLYPKADLFALLDVLVKGGCGFLGGRSVSHPVAKSVLTGPDQTHVSHVFSPIRFAWDLGHDLLVPILGTPVDFAFPY